MKTSNVIAGMLVGIAAGAAIGILFAPDKGSATRKKLSKQGADLADTLKDKFGGLVDTVVSKYEDAKATFADVTDGAEEEAV